MNSIGCSKSIPFYNETTWGVDSPIKIESTQSIDNFIAIYCFLPFYWIEILHSSVLTFFGVCICLLIRFFFFNFFFFFLQTFVVIFGLLFANAFNDEDDTCKYKFLIVKVIKNKILFIKLTTLVDSMHHQM